MDKLKDGIVEVGGVVLDKNTTLEDLQNIGIEKAAQRFHGNQFLEVLFNDTVEKGGVTFKVSVRASQHDESKVIILDPVLTVTYKDILDESKAKQQLCEDWLKVNMDVPPTRDTDDGIYYDFPWGHIYNTAAEHIHFGHISGSIQIIYGQLPL